jgi:hypothetical protein
LMMISFRHGISLHLCAAHPQLPVTLRTMAQRTYPASLARRLAGGRRLAIESVITGRVVIYRAPASDSNVVSSSSRLLYGSHSLRGSPVQQLWRLCSDASMRGDLIQRYVQP